jgi:hypothetical protein
VRRSPFNWPAPGKGLRLNSPHVRFKASYALLSDLCRMERARRKFETVTRTQANRPSLLGQTKRNRALNYVNDLVVCVRMGSVTVTSRVPPSVPRKAFRSKNRFNIPL